MKKPPDGSKSKGLFGAIFVPSVDFYAMLNRQADKTLEGMKALEVWLREDGEERCETVRELERQADDLKLELGKRLQESFITPFDREDIYDLSARLDEVINSAKATVREIEAFGIKPGDHPIICEMAGILVRGTECLALSFRALKDRREEANEHARAARKLENQLTKTYRQAMQVLFTLDDVKEILRVREVYKSLLAGAERIDVVGEKLAHAIVKME